MEEKQKLPQLIFKKVKNSKAIKNFDLEKRLVCYSCEIKQHRKIEKLNGKEGEVSEEMVRAYLLDKLSDELGYDLEKIEIDIIKTKKDLKKRIFDMRKNPYQMPAPNGE
jgi:hypothetical protein